jgi:hypothetical protein
MSGRADVALVLGERTVAVDADVLVQSSCLFGESPELLTGGEYRVRTEVTEDVLDVFVDALLGRGYEVDVGNFAALEALSWEFGFIELFAACNRFAEGHPEVAPSADDRCFRQILICERKVDRLDSTVAALLAEFGSLKNEFASLVEKLDDS